MIFRSFLSISCILFIVFQSIAQKEPSLSNQPLPDYSVVASQGFVASKNYYLLTLFSEIKDVRQLLARDSALTILQRQKADSLNSTLKNCLRMPSCYIAPMKFSEEEIKIVSDRLSALYQPNNALGKVVKQHLIPSGYYYLFQQLSEKELLLKAWEQDARGINFALDIYAEGKKPKYPAIDSISLGVIDVNRPGVYTNGYINLLYNTASLLLTTPEDSRLFSSLPLRAALIFIELNERNQAADFEPMEKGENKAAYDKVKTTNFSKFPYSVIVVPGAGPDDPAQALSPEGMLRCKLAAIQYQQGLAPFIMPSGGKVHPYKTKYCEATEMKRYLVDELKIPAYAIIIEPHARHTTTNMRNAVRLMYRYGFPMTQPGLTCTTRGQSMSIEKTLVARCQKELGAVPYKPGVRLSETAVAFYPLLEALHINPTEPIDP